MRLIKYLYRHAGRLLLIASCAAIVSGIAGSGIVVIVGQVIRGGETTVLCWVYVAVCLTWLLAKSGSEIALLHASQHMVLRLRVSLSRDLLATPTSTIEALTKSGISAILTKDVDAVVGALQLVPRTLGNAITVAACLAYTASMSWRLAGLSAAVFTIGAVAYLVLERHPRRRLATVRARLDQVYKDMRSLVEGTRELQLNSQRGEMFITNVIKSSAEAFRAALIRSMTSYTWIANGGVAAFYAAIGLLLFAVPRWLPYEPKTLASLVLVLLYLVGPMGELMALLPALRQASIGLNRIEHLDTVFTTSCLPVCTQTPFDAERGVVLELTGVSHEYAPCGDDKGFMLGPVDLRVKAGEILFVIGGNGSGKSTLAMLLVGLYSPLRGSIALNGVRVSPQNILHYRQHFSAVFSDCFIFDQLLLCDDLEMQKRVRHYLELFGMSRKVSVVDGSYSTTQLSAGQKKRLALVSAYLEDRPIYVFDEWAADQDPLFKRTFYREILTDLKRRGKAIVVITHDDGYFGCADRIVRLEDGRLDTTVPLPAHCAAVG